MSAIVAVTAGSSPVAENAATPTAARPPRPGAERRGRRRAQALAELHEGDVLVEEADLRARHGREVAAMLRPSGAWQEWIAGEVATLMVRITRTERVERKLRAYASYRAIDFWEDDQKLEAETLGRKLAKVPARVVARLRLSPAGCDWLARQWRTLAAVETADWSPEQRALATHLVGGDPAVDPTRIGFIAEQVADLAAQRVRVEEADAILRGLVEADLSDDGVPGLAQLRRYARSLQRRLTWCLDHFHLAASLGIAAPSPAPATPPVEPISETKPIASEQAPKIDETKPISPEQTPRIDETKPFERLIAEFHDMEAASLGSHPLPYRHADPAREAARRQKATRRAASLAGMVTC